MRFLFLLLMISSLVGGCGGDGDPEKPVSPANSEHIEEPVNLAVSEPPARVKQEDANQEPCWPF